MSRLSSHTCRRSGRSRTATIMMATVLLVLAGLNSAHAGPSGKTERAATTKPTVVLVHGSWADASSWNGVITRLQGDGYPVRAIPNELRSLSSDAAYVRTFLKSVTGPVVLVGHSYGGAVITNAATGVGSVKALVYVDGFAPDEGEGAGDLLGPDSALSVDPTTVFDFVPATVPPTPDTDVYLKKSTVFNSFANGLSAQQKALIFGTQRPGKLGALYEPSGPPAWRTIPSWDVIGTQDHIIPASSQRKMAERAGSKVTEVNAGHLSMITNPGVITRVIEQAARATACH
jgi:pimeloyl-ACP methyl ester carboxylesterase